MKKKNYRIVKKSLTHGDIFEIICVLKEVLEWSDITIVNGYVRLIPDGSVDILREHNMVVSKYVDFNTIQRQYSFEVIAQLLDVLSKCDIVEWEKEHV